MTRYHLSTETSPISFQSISGSVRFRVFSNQRFPPVHHQIILSIRSLKPTNFLSDVQICWMTQNHSTDQTAAVFKVINMIADRPLIVFMSLISKRASNMKNVRIAFVLRQLLSGFRLLSLSLSMMIFIGCESVSFYHQLASGQTKILLNRQEIEQLILDPSTDKELREQLLKVESVKNYAESNLGLVTKGSFSSYVDLNREYVLWNVFASKPYSVEAVNKCYPIVGCVPYRGYFSRQAAISQAGKLAQQGFEIYVGGVPAYSTLGWFEDPVLNTFIFWKDHELASLIIHEILHQNFWLKDDVNFNEGLANFVGDQAAMNWVESRTSPESAGQFADRRNQWKLFRQFVVLAKGYLSKQFASSSNPAHLESIKRSGMARVRLCFQELKPLFLGANYEDLVNSNRFNNAFIASVGVYESNLFAFKRLYELSDRNWSVFFKKVEGLMALSLVERLQMLRALSDDHVASQGDNYYPDQVYCETLGNQGLS